MGIITKELPYELLIRFSDGAAHQAAKPGEFEGAHYIARKRMVDEDTGEIVGTPRGEEMDKAIAIPQDVAARFFGAEFAAFDAAHRALQAAHDAACAERDALTEQLQRAAVQIAELQAAHATATQKLAAAQQALA